MCVCVTVCVHACVSNASLIGFANTDNFIGHIAEWSPEDPQGTSSSCNKPFRETGNGIRDVSMLLSQFIFHCFASNSSSCTSSLYLILLSGCSVVLWLPQKKGYHILYTSRKKKNTTTPPLRTSEADTAIFSCLKMRSVTHSRSPSKVHTSVVFSAKSPIMTQKSRPLLSKDSCVNTYTLRLSVLLPLVRQDSSDSAHHKTPDLEDRDKSLNPLRTAHHEVSL